MLHGHVLSKTSVSGFGIVNVEWLSAKSSIASIKGYRQAGGAMSGVKSGVYLMHEICLQYVW